MKVAVIDLGTNTFHLLIARVDRDSHEMLHRERKAVKIGEKGINKGEITKEAWGRALKALHEFKEMIDANDIDQVFATATSAIRNANNGQALVDEIKSQTGIEIEVISGMREAELIHHGASKALDFGEEKNLIMDIGGGSIEFIIADNQKAHWMQSFEVGGQRLVEMFHKTDPISTDEIEKLNAFFDKELQPLVEACKEFRPTTLIGCSGTFDTLSDIYCEENDIERQSDATEYPFGKNVFKKIYEDLITKNREQRLAIPGMIEMRVDMIVVACVLIDHIVEKIALTNIRISAYALKEGILYNVLDQLQEGNSSH
ncbi:exopolyphosphatase / guanosine-5'-triphosphate,3'-diphosphate pyrophosphatase [Ekhidna lutea]|uniref:Exopolyphosphatase / guanosine-5'-triphosphate,3'-diphosphate pyrophosphatase n=1 Tax=Ekhidna lutea TaxID=447679 RepID=A0A239K477_EKHLU|nr:exopolyphosphatase [Ekhidna lutea]SNT12821.1 exopolyphosphatase / guanosine-5'-triphosphate,3'-diphosphate pyrophosphatase [Ekhidna lutea]